MSDIEPATKNYVTIIVESVISLLNVYAIFAIFIVLIGAWGGISKFVEFSPLFIVAMLFFVAELANAVFNSENWNMASGFSEQYQLIYLSLFILNLIAVFVYIYFVAVWSSRIKKRLIRIGVCTAILGVWFCAGFIRLGSHG